MDVIDELIACCEAWEPEVCVMGNVRAGDAAQALRNLRAELETEESRRHEVVRERNALRAELAVERKRQSAMRTLIASQEGTLSHYRSKQAEADEAVRTLDSERQANATLTAELSECKADAERYHWIKQCALFGITKRQDIVLTLPIYAANHIGELDAGIDAARKGKGE